MLQPPLPPAEPRPPARSQLHQSRALRALLWFCGVVALVIGAIGVVLPGLPTTPFVLVAGACFVRASPRAHAWLLRNRTFGPLLREWEAHRSVSRRIKRIALAMMTLTATGSLWALAGHPWLQATVLAGVAGGCLAVWWLPSRR